MRTIQTQRQQEICLKQSKIPNLENAESKSLNLVNFLLHCIFLKVSDKDCTGCIPRNLRKTCFGKSLEVRESFSSFEAGKNKILRQFIIFRIFCLFFNLLFVGIVFPSHQFILIVAKNLKLQNSLRLFVSFFNSFLIQTTEFKLLNSNY